MPVISLTTDFGLCDEYAGVMKGVMLSIAPDVRIVDICHHIEPHDIFGAAAMVRASYRFFPPETVHVVVVDPGVGTGRDIIAFRMNGHMFLAPDNGLAAMLTEGQGVTHLTRVDNSRYYLDDVSTTFHGRDIFAPVAAHLSGRGFPEDLGTGLQVSELVRAVDDRDRVVTACGQIEGKIIRVDHFGNLITNIDSELIRTEFKLTELSELEVSVGTYQIQGITRTYGSVAGNTLIALTGSRGNLEVAVNCGNASQVTGLSTGASVIVKRSIPEE